MPRIRLLVWSLLILNAIDAFSTVTAVQLGIAREENPLMRALLSISPWGFLAVKLLVGGLLLGLLYLRAQPSSQRHIRWALYFLNGVYVLLALQHIRVWTCALSALWA